MKRLSLTAALLSAVMLSGCGSSHKIETAAVIENVSVDSRGGQIYYTFFRLTGGDTPDGTEIPADSFEQACDLARREYIPNLSLAKLELLMINRDICGEVLKRDIEYISTQSSFSPMAYFTLCDSQTLKSVCENTSVQQLIEEQLALCKSQNADVNISYLSLFNSYSRADSGDVTVPYVSCDGEIRISAIKISK